MDPTYVNVMETGELAYVMGVYVLHGAMAAAQAALALFLLVTGGRMLRRREPGASARDAAARAGLGVLLLLPLVTGAPAVVSGVAGALAFGLLLAAERRSAATSTRLGLSTRRAAVACAAFATLFMLWEREDNLALAADLLVHTFEFRNEEVSWQHANDPRSPKVGELAPDFELQDPQGVARVRLSDFRGERPVALVFGSYT